MVQADKTKFRGAAAAAAMAEAAWDLEEAKGARTAVGWAKVAAVKAAVGVPGNKPACWKAATATEEAQTQLLRAQAAAAREETED